MSPIDPRELFLRIYPDPILKKKSKPFQLPLPANIRAIGARMAEIMQDEGGIGLAGPQAGLSQRIIVYDLSEEREAPQVLINPEIIESHGTMESDEGCLSFPEIRGVLARAARVVVRGLDLAGQEQRIEAEELLCAMFQHEIDHLDGITFVDRLPPVERMRIKEELEELARVTRG